MKVVGERHQLDLGEFAGDDFPRSVGAAVVDDKDSISGIRLLEHGLKTIADVVPSIPVQDDDIRQVRHCAGPYAAARLVSDGGWSRPDVIRIRSTRDARWMRFTSIRLRTLGRRVDESPHSGHEHRRVERLRPPLTCISHWCQMVGRRASDRPCEVLGGRWYEPSGLSVEERFSVAAIVRRDDDFSGGHRFHGCEPEILVSGGRDEPSACRIELAESRFGDLAEEFDIRGWVQRSDEPFPRDTELRSSHDEKLLAW